MTSEDVLSPTKKVSVYLYSTDFTVEDMVRRVGHEPSWSILYGAKVGRSNLASRHNAVRYDVTMELSPDGSIDALLIEAIKIAKLLSPAHNSSSTFGIQIRSDQFSFGDSISIGGKLLKEISALKMSLDILF